MLGKGNALIKTETFKLHYNAEYLNKMRWRNNITVAGLHIDTDMVDELKQGMETFLWEKLEVEVCVKAVYKLRQRLCLLELHSFQDMLKVMKSKNKLRKNKDQPILINIDWMKNEIEILQQIYEEAQKEKRRKEWRLR